MGSKRVNWKARRAEIAEAALELLLEKPREEVTLAAVAERVDLNYWQVSRAFGTPEELYRGAATMLIERIAESLNGAPEPRPSVVETIRAYVGHAAQVMATDAYRALVYFCVRDACAHPWLADAYRTRIANPLKRGIEEAVSRAALRSGTLVGLRRGAADRFLSRLEATIVAPKLLPSGNQPVAEEAANISPLVAELIGASYAMEAAAA